MVTSAQPSARILAKLLAGHGVVDVVLSPGSRNAPLAVAVSRQPELRTRVVVDERSAGFVALGMAVQSMRPVALICTSGTALLNYAPAVAEAYYRCVPLIVVSADRPARWIDQDDSQTIRQYEALTNIVNMSVDVGSDSESTDYVWYANRLINDAILSATSRRPGPVHINIHLDEPLGLLAEDDNAPDEGRIIKVLKSPLTLPTSEMRRLAREWASPPRRLLIVAGFMPPSDKMTRAFNTIAEVPNIAVFYEAQSNLHHVRNGFGSIDRLLSSCSEETLEAMKPDVVVTVGGSLVSRMIKRWLRGSTGIKHIHIGFGPRERSVDVFKMLDTRIEVDPELFMSAFASAVKPFRSSDGPFYSKKWHDIANRIDVTEFDKTWSDLAAVRKLISGLGSRTNLHVSNGTSVRYLQLTDYSHIHRIESNRGVSGIDGSTSTAVGASFAYTGPTVLLTGDMSATYDIGALTLSDIPSRFSIVVLNNSGGDIFRVIGSTRNLDEREDLFCCPRQTDFKGFAAATGFDYIRVTGFIELEKAIDVINESKRSKPLLVEIMTEGSDNAGLLRKYLGDTNRLKL